MTLTVDVPIHRGVTVRVENLTIEYPNPQGSPFRAVTEVSFDVQPGRRLALVGPSGCGKSSILKVMVDLIQPASGQVLHGSLTPRQARQKRALGFVPQQHALLKWRTTIQNIALPLELAGQERTRIRQRVDELLALFALKDFASFYPGQLSGGMRSRVSIARALANEPDVLLLDECFGSLDVMTRERLYKELSPMWSQLGTTLVFITHSVPEAVYLADDVVVLSPSPARVIEKLKIDAPQPRDPAFMSSNVFHEATRRLRDALEL
jgi:NitT/TauT family transport system ATP-binding protein